MNPYISASKNTLYFSLLPPCVDTEIVQIIPVKLIAGFAIIGADH